MYRNRSVAALLREQSREHERQLERKDEMIQSLLDRIQHPERTPIWREAPPEPLPDFDSSYLSLIADPEQMA